MFLDRDGVLNRDAPGFVTRPDGLHILPGAAKAVALLKQAGFRVVVATNQSGVGRGLMTEDDLQAVHEKLLRELSAEGGRLDAIYYCPHTPWDGCDCRKPLPGMLLRASADHGLDLTRCYFIGDKPTDISAGKAAGCRTVLVLSGLEPTYRPEMFPDRPDHVCADVLEAALWVLEDSGAAVEATSRDATARRS